LLVATTPCSEVAVEVEAEVEVAGDALVVAVFSDIYISF
jgi:hypothetical protein